MISWEYIAGFFDGEGCVSRLHKNNPHNNQHNRIFWRILIGQKDRNVLDEIQKFIGYGKVYRIRKSPNLYYCYTIVKQHEVIDFLKRVSSYVIVKRKQLQITLEHPWQKIRNVCVQYI